MELSEDIIADAMRYRWLKEQSGLSLTSERPVVWTRENGTTFVPTHRLSSNGIQYGAYATLDETIDNARLTLQNVQRDDIVGS